MTTTENEAPAPQTGYAPVNGLQMYYEIHGAGGTPLLLLHGGLFDIDQQFGEVLPGLSATRQVIAADFQGHGRTNDIDRPLTSAASPPTSSACCSTWRWRRSTCSGSASAAPWPCTWRSAIRSWSAR